MRVCIVSLFFSFLILNHTAYAQLDDKGVAPIKPGEYFEPGKSIESIHFQGIGWNGKFWLIGGRVLPKGPTFLIVYDGKEFTDVINNELIKDIWVENISWNGKEWVIRESPNVLGSKNRIITYTYDGKTLTQTGIERYTYTFNRTEELEGTYEVCSESYCLIWKRVDGKLLRYDGKNYTDLTKESGIQFPFESVRIMSWNGEYWLIGYGGTEGGGVVKYDGKSFTTLTGFPHVLPAEVPQFLQTMPAVIVWNGNYWLIGTVASPRLSGSLIMYDGVAPVDLTPRIRSAIMGSEILKALKQPTSETLPTPKLFIAMGIIIALVAVLLIASALFLLWRKK